MSTTSTARTSRFADTLGIFAVTLGLVLGLVPGIAHATHAPGHEAGDPLGAGVFEIDGNTGATSGHDWADIATYADDSEQATDGSGQDDDIFTPHLVESHYPNWTFTQQSTPQKSDLLELFAASQVAGADSFLWLGASRAADNGSTQVTVEFNQEDGETLELDGGYRVTGDFYITWNFPGKPKPGKQPENVQVKVGDWPDGQETGAYPTEVLLSSSAFRYAIGGISDPDAFDFIELELDLSVLFGSGGLDTACGQFGAVSFRTESSGGGGGGTDESTFKDVAGPFPIDLDTCADVEVEKVDEEGNPLNGVQFSAFAGYDAEVTLDPAATCITGPDATDPDPDNPEADGECSLGALLPGNYTLHETGVPNGYVASPDLPDNFTVQQNTPLDLPDDLAYDPPLDAYTDPRLDYELNITPTGRNPVDTDHDFTVTLRRSDTQAGLSGQTITLDWGGTVGGIDTDDDGIADGNSTTCETDANGQCTVTVVSPDFGSDKLTATWTTPYANHDGTTATPTDDSDDSQWAETDGTAHRTLSNSAAKTWVDYTTTIEEDATNLVGDAHTFTATVYELDGIGEPDGALADGVTVSVEWTGPDGSTLDGSLYDPDGAPVTSTCVTGPNDPNTPKDETGTCTFEVDSDVSGSGDIAITRLDGKVLDSDGVTERDLPVTFGDGEEFDHPPVTAKKTWREYRAQIGRDALNPVGQDHPFDVWVEYSENGGDSWSPAAIKDMKVEWEVDGADPTTEEEDASDCDEGTQSDGTCTIVVTSNSFGSETVKLLSVTGNLLPEDDPDLTNLTYTFSDSQYVKIVNDEEVETGNRESTKTWLLFGATIVADGDNLVSTDGDTDRGEHVFTVTVWRQPAPGATEAPVPAETKVTVVPSSDDFGDPSSLVTEDDCALKGTTNVELPDGTLASQCTVTVNSSNPGSLTMTVTGLESYDFGGDFGVQAPVLFTGDLEPRQATKTWYRYRGFIETSGTNLLGEQHQFTVTAQVDDGSDDDDDGSDWDPVLDDTVVTVTSDSHPLTEFDQSDCADGTTGGTCMVYVNSTTPGTVKLTVDTVGNLSADDSPETEVQVSQSTLDVGQSTSATKTWIAYRAQIQQTETNLTGQQHVFQVTAEQNDGVDDNGDQDAWDPVPNGTEITYTPQTDPDITISDTCDSTVDGACTITVSSDDVDEITVTLTGVAADDVDDPEAVATVGNGALSATVTDGLSATKTWIEVLVDVTPDNPTNIAGDAHEFTVDLTITGPNGAIDHTGASVGFKVDGADIIYDDELDGVTGSTCDEALAAGQDSCTIVVHSNSAGTADVSVTSVAFSHGGKDFPAIDFTDTESSIGKADGQDLDATKTWRVYRAAIEADDLNRTHDEHTFTVAVEYSDDGQIWSFADGVDVTIGKVSGVGSVTDGECTTGAQGTCTVTVNSATAGTGTFEVVDIVVDDPATAGVDERTLGDGDVAFDNNDTADKTWAAFRAWISRDSANITGDEHLFTVKAQYTVGGDWLAVPDGTTVDVSTSGTGSIIDSTEFDSTCEDSLVGTTGGSCDVWVDSADAGSLDVTVDGLTATVVINSETDDEMSREFTVVFDYDGVDDPNPDTDGDPNPGVLDNFENAGQLLVDDPTVNADPNGDYVASKTWASYQLRLEPETAVNLLDGSSGDPEKDHVITAFLTSDDPGTAEDPGIAPVIGQTIRFSIDDLDLDGPATITATDGGEIFTEAEADGADATCVTNETGTCTITITRDTPGQAIVDAWYSATVGDSAAQTIDSDTTATKTWTTFRLTVTPGQAVNLVDNPHDFTVTLWESILTADCGDAAVNGFCRVQTGDAISISVPGDTSEDDLTVDTTDCDDGTNAQGQCVVTVTSGSVRAITLTASYLESYADYDSEVTGTTDAVFSNDPPAGKRWIDYDIDVDPDTDQNLVNTPHTFTVTVTTTVPSEDGTTTMGVVGAKPEVFLSGPGSIVPDGNTCAEGTVDDNPATEDIDETGTCTVTITSAVPGLSTLDASYLGIASGVDPVDTSDDESRTYDTRETEEDDSGDKLWVDYLLDLSPNAVNTVDDPHTFTATLRRSDDGADDEDYLAVQGATLDFTVDGVGDRVAGEGDVGEDLTCVTDAAGTCDLVINSAEAGATDVSVSYDAIVGTTERTDTVDRTKQWVDIELVKTAVTTDGFADGDLIADPGGFPFLSFTSSDRGPKTAVFEYLITNPSNVTLEEVALVDDRLGTIDLTQFPACLTLDPGEVCTARGSEQFDYDDATASLASLITNVGTVTATGGGEDVSDTDDATITLVAVQSSILIDLVKDVVAGQGAVQEVDGLPIVRWSQEEYEAGESKTVRYRFTVTNISNSPIIDVELIDPMISDQPIISVSDGVTLQPGESTVVEVDHLLTADEAFPDGPIATKVDNVASVTGANETRDSFSEDTDDASVFTEIVFAEVLEKPLPATGFGSGGLVPLSVLLIAVGAAILWLDRRRTTVR